MNIEEFKKEMAKNKNNFESKKSVNDAEVREKAMQAYLDDVVPISEYINKGFEEIEAKQLTKKEGNQGGR